MPILGEVIKGDKIRKLPASSKFIWTSCIDCGKERWVRLVKGIPTHDHCLSCNYSHPRRGAENGHWKGGKVKAGRFGEYIAIKLQPDDFFFSMANKERYVLEHRLVMAKHLNRCLLFWEVVHHKNGIGTENKIENLQLLPSQSYHIVDSQVKSFITKLENRVKQLEVRVTLLEAENAAFRAGGSIPGIKTILNTTLRVNTK